MEKGRKQKMGGLDAGINQWSVLLQVGSEVVSSNPVLQYLFLAIVV
jgi:hypothetical protein